MWTNGLIVKPNVPNPTQDNWVPDDIFIQLEKDIEDSSTIESDSFYNRFLQLSKYESYQWNDRQISMLVKLLGKPIYYNMEEVRSTFVDELFNTIPENVLANLLRTNFELLRREKPAIYRRLFSENEIIEIYSNFVCSDALAGKYQMEVLEMLRNYSTKSYLQLAMELICSRTTRNCKIQRNDILLHLLDNFFVKTYRGGTKIKYIHSLDSEDYMDEHGDLLLTYMPDFEDMLLLESKPEGVLLLSEILVTIVPHSSPRILLSMLFSDKMNVRYQRKLLDIMRRHFGYLTQKEYDPEISEWEMKSAFGSVRKLFKLFSTTKSSMLRTSIEDCLLQIAYGPENLQTVIGFLEIGVDIEVRRSAMRLLSYSPHEYAIKPLLNLYYSGEMNSFEDQKYVFRILSRLSGDVITDFYWHLLLNGAENFHSEIVNKLILTTPLTALFNKLTDKIELSESNITSCIEHYTNSKTIFESLTSLYSSHSNTESISSFRTDFNRIKNLKAEKYLKSDLTILNDLSNIYLELEKLNKCYQQLKKSSFCVNLIEGNVPLSNSILIEKAELENKNFMDFEGSSVLRSMGKKHNFDPDSLSPFFNAVRSHLRGSLFYYSHMRLLHDEWLCTSVEGIPNYMRAYDEWSNADDKSQIIKSAVHRMMQRAKSNYEKSSITPFDINRHQISDFISTIEEEFERIAENEHRYRDYKRRDLYPRFLAPTLTSGLGKKMRRKKIYDDFLVEVTMKMNIEILDYRFLDKLVKDSCSSSLAEINALSLFRIHPAFWMDIENHIEARMEKAELVKKNLQFSSDSWNNRNADIASVTDLLSILIRCRSDSGARLILGKYLINHRCINLDLDLVSQFVLSLESSNGFHGYFNRLIPQLDSSNAIEILKSFRKKAKILNLFLTRFDEMSKLFDEKTQLVDNPQTISEEWWDNSYLFTDKVVQDAISELRAVNDSNRTDGTLKIGIQWKNSSR